MVKRLYDLPARQPSTSPLSPIFCRQSSRTVLQRYPWQQRLFRLAERHWCVHVLRISSGSFGCRRRMCVYVCLRAVVRRSFARPHYSSTDLRKPLAHNKPYSVLNCPRNYPQKIHAQAVPYGGASTKTNLLIGFGFGYYRSLRAKLVNFRRIIKNKKVLVTKSDRKDH